MGIIAHHAIIVTGSHGDWPQKAHDQAIGNFPEGQVSPLGPKAINGHQSFCVFPDGSKEGWEDSDDGDNYRDHFIEWLNDQRYEDGSSPMSWVEVQYGELPGANGATVTRHAWKKWKRQVTK